MRLAGKRLAASDPNERTAAWMQRREVMSKMSWRLTLAGAFVACALGGIALRVASATPAAGLSVMPIVGPVLMEEATTKSASDINEVEIENKGASEVYVAQLGIVPGGHGGWHSHPGPSIISVKSGTATFYQGDDLNRTPHVYPAGTGFFEDARRVHIVRNEGTTDLVLVVLQIVPAGAPRRFDEPRPPQYSF
jgi:quercetin dioxygenase-like cupin family protein